MRLFGYSLFLILTLSLANGAVAPKKAHKPVAHKKTGTKPGKRSVPAVAARSHKSSPPRQQTPSTERYAEIQQALAAKGYYQGETSGVWNADSVNALKRFQAEQNLSPDGKIGSKSLIALGLGPTHESTMEVPPVNPPAPQSQEK